MVQNGRKLRSSRKARKASQASQGKDTFSNADSLRTKLDWLLPDASIFAKVRFHGNVSWTASRFVVLAMFWSWSEARHVTDAFVEASRWCVSLWGCSPLTTYQGFMEALAKWSPSLLPLLVAVLQQRMADLAPFGKFYRVAQWVPIAFDGSRSSVARTKSNETEFCAKNYGRGWTATYRKKKTKGMRRRKNQKNPAQPQEPQAWITMLWHMGLRLPWDWRLGPSNASERDHVMAMIAEGHFPRGTLLCGDAGFVGYRFWSCLVHADLNFLIRVGANVSLLSQYAHCHFEKSGKQCLVLCWPKEAIRTGLPPLRLRLSRLRTGKTSVWLLTNVLDEHRLTRSMMERFYKMRWGVELEFRGLKQTLERAKLRCRNSRRLLAELNWSIMGMAIAELLAVKEQLMARLENRAARPKRLKPTRVYDPSQRSLANTMRALRGGLKNLHEKPQPGHDLTTLLANALTDDYTRKASKNARYRPRNPDKKKLGNPEIRRLSKIHRLKLNHLHPPKAA